MAVAVDNTKIVASGIGYQVVNNAATVDSANGSEVFTITPTVAERNTVIRVINGAGHGALAFSIAAGDFWASKAITGSVSDGKSEIIQIEGAYSKQDVGTILLTLTPASGKKLLSEHAASVEVYSTL